MYESLQDWNTHLQNTFVFFHRDEAILPFYVRDVRGPGDLDDPEEYELNDLSLRGSFVYRNREGNIQLSGNLTRHPEDYSEVQVGLPPVGYTNHSEFASFLSYNNTRQFRKSFNNRLIRVQSPVIGEIDYIGLIYRERVNEEIIYNMINQNFTPYYDALEEIRQGDKLSRAITQTLAVCAKMGIDVPVIYYKTTPIGWANNHGEITMPQSLSYLYEEVMQIPNFEEGMIRYE